MIVWSTLVLALVTLQRVSELILARRNTANLLARGAIEKSPAHYPAIVAVHSIWLAGLWLLGAGAPINLFWLAVFIFTQIMRFWVLWSLGARWTTRIIVVPGENLIRRGPYRLVDHPNYIVVTAEIAVLPLMFGLTTFAVVFSILNAGILMVRIPAETRALADVQSKSGAPVH
jgi:methyltransferase